MLCLPYFRNVWWPTGEDATFFFVECLGLDTPTALKKSCHVLIISADGDYVSKSLAV